MIPVIAFIGRSNVGKSSLFNCFTHSSDALISPFSGLTRDRKYGNFEIKGYEFICIDTAGIDKIEENIETCTLKQSLLAIEEADIVLLILDATEGLMLSDIRIAKYLRRCNKSVFVIANKIDKVDTNLVMADFHSLGFGNVYPLSSFKKKGVSIFLETLLKFSKEKKLLFLESKRRGKLKKHEGNKIGVSYNSHLNNALIKLAIVGRPNVGKSTLTNCILGEERMVISNTPGTTRDSVYIPVRFDNHMYLLIDTAGIRKHRKIKEEAEKFSVIRSLKEIEQANVVMLVIDACIGVSDQDLSLISFILKSGRSFVIIVNKWDNINREERKRIKNTIDYRLKFVNFARVHFISALYGKGIDKLFEFVREAYGNSVRSISSRVLTRIMMTATMEHKPPLIKGRGRAKMKYAHSGGHSPFTVVIHGNKVKDLQNSYKHYLANYFHKKLEMIGSPIHLQFKESKNPFFNKKRHVNKNLSE